MSFIITVLYPNKDDITFDMKYYREVHLPLAEKLWKPMGMLKWELIDVGPSHDGQKQQYRVICVLTFKDRESWTAAAMMPGVAEVMDDVPNFCNYEPIFIGGQLIGSG